jgi:hypothetical protein
MSKETEPAKALPRPAYRTMSYRIDRPCVVLVPRARPRPQSFVLPSVHRVSSRRRALRERAVSCGASLLHTPLQSLHVCVLRHGACVSDASDGFRVDISSFLTVIKRSWHGAWAMAVMGLTTGPRRRADWPKSMAHTFPVALGAECRVYPVGTTQVMWEERKDTAREGGPMQEGGETVASFELRSFVLDRIEDNRGGEEREGKRGAETPPLLLRPRSFS